MNQANWNIINDKVGAQFTAGVQNYVNGLVNAYRGAVIQPTYRTATRRTNYNRYNRNHKKY